MRTILFIIICGLLSFASLTSQNQPVIDSLEQLFQNEKSDSIKTYLIAAMINDGGMVNQDNILNTLERGLKIAQKNNKIEWQLILLLSAASKMAFAGHNEKALEMYTSLKEKAELADIQRFSCRANIGISRLLMEKGNMEAAEKLLMECPDLLRDNVKNNNDRNALGRSYNELSIIYRNRGQMDIALDYLDSVIFLYKEDDTTLEHIAAYSNRGRIFRFQGLNDSAKVNYLKAESLAVEMNDLSTLSTIYNNLGNIEHIAGNYEKAIEYYINSINIKEKTGNTRGLAIGFHNVGAIKFDMKDWDGALKDFKKSNKIASDIDFSTLVVHNENKLGNVYYEQASFEKAIKHHSFADSLATAINFKTGYISAKYHLGRDFIETNQLNEANTILLEALKLAEESNNKPNESAILVALATAYVKSKKITNGTSLSESTGLSSKEVEQLLLRSNTLADEMGYVENKKKVLEGLHLFYKDSRNHRADASILEELISLNDSIYSQERTKAIADWETKYHVAEKDKEIFQLETEKTISELKSKQTRNLFGSLLTILCLLGIFGYYYLNQRTKKRQAKQRELFRSKLSSDLHDDVGTILTGLAMQSELLSNFVNENMKAKAIEIASLSRDAMGRMRDTVWAIDSRKDTVDDLVDRMIDFAEQNLMAKEIKLEFNTNLDNKDAKIEPEVRQNIYLIFKEAIANILKHSNADKVNVQFLKSRDNINLQIHDNGKISQDKGNKASGIGMTSMRERVSNIRGIMEIIPSNGFTIKITVPLIT